MNVEEYARMYSLEDTYWWYQGRQRIIFALLDSVGALERPEGAPAPRVVDVGCGTGMMLEKMAARCRPVGLDFSPLALDFCRRRGLDDLARSEATALPLADGSVDLALALDLLEHIDDDAAVYAEIARALKPGGHAVITAPAYPFLWSTHDEALHHCRRYTRATFRRLLGGADLEVVRLTHAITITCAPIVAFRFLTRPFMKRAAPRAHVIVLPRWLNRFLIWLHGIEASLLRRVNLPFGVSLLAVLRKPAA